MPILPRQLIALVIAFCLPFLLSKLVDMLFWPESSPHLLFVVCLVIAFVCVWMCFNQVQLQVCWKYLSDSHYRRVHEYHSEQMKTKELQKQASRKDRARFEKTMSRVSAETYFDKGAGTARGVIGPRPTRLGRIKKRLARVGLGFWTT